ncbi:101 kDa malaria antigen-like [Vespa mandarinia]|uniref:101 kDa malaria antigen-like n=1 Tax=Vespa mandarinia TaxID=7446 RepID=UPI00161EAAAA|nr:101 kDa malaria antigen-like [Vespa mandarinia]
MATNPSSSSSCHTNSVANRKNRHNGVRVFVKHALARVTLVAKKKKKKKKKEKERKKNKWVKGKTFAVSRQDRPIVSMYLSPVVKSDLEKGKEEEEEEERWQEKREEEEKEERKEERMEERRCTKQDRRRRFYAREDEQEEEEERRPAMSLRNVGPCPFSP